MKAYTYTKPGTFELLNKPKPVILDSKDAIVKITLASICSSDLHIKHGSVPQAVTGITIGHEMVGIVESVGSSVTKVKPGDRVTVNVETFCGECFYCKNGWVNNCADPQGGWSLGCRIDGGQAEYVRVPYANNTLDLIPADVTDEQALFVGDILATGYWAVKISDIKTTDTVLIIGAGPTGICTLQCVLLKSPARVIVCEPNQHRTEFVKEHFPTVTVVSPDNLNVQADVVLEIAGTSETFEMAWRNARPSGTVTVVALYDSAQILPLPEMYGKNLTFKFGGVDACDCSAILDLISLGQINTTPLITHSYPLSRIEEAYAIFEGKKDNVIKVAITMESC